MAKRAAPRLRKGEGLRNETRSASVALRRPDPAAKVSEASVLAARIAADIRTCSLCSRPYRKGGICSCWEPTWRGGRSGRWPSGWWLPVFAFLTMAAIVVAILALA